MVPACARRTRSWKASGCSMPDGDVDVLDRPGCGRHVERDRRRGGRRDRRPRRARRPSRDPLKVLHARHRRGDGRGGAATVETRPATSAIRARRDREQAHRHRVRVTGGAATPPGSPLADPYDARGRRRRTAARRPSRRWRSSARPDAAPWCGTSRSGGWSRPTSLRSSPDLLRQMRDLDARCGSRPRPTRPCRPAGGVPSRRGAGRPCWTYAQLAVHPLGGAGTVRGGTRRGRRRWSGAAGGAMPGVLSHALPTRSPSQSVWSALAIVGQLSLVSAPPSLSSSGSQAITRCGPGRGRAGRGCGGRRSCRRYLSPARSRCPRRSRTR